MRTIPAGTIAVELLLAYDCGNVRHCKAWLLLVSSVPVSTARSDTSQAQLSSFKIASMNSSHLCDGQLSDLLCMLCSIQTRCA